MNLAEFLIKNNIQASTYYQETINNWVLQYASNIIPSLMAKIVPNSLATLLSYTNFINFQDSNSLFKQNIKWEEEKKLIKHLLVEKADINITDISSGERPITYFIKQWENNKTQNSNNLSRIIFILKNKKFNSSCRNNSQEKYQDLLNNKPELKQQIVKYYYQKYEEKNIKLFLLIDAYLLDSLEAINSFSTVLDNSFDSLNKNLRSSIEKNNQNMQEILKNLFSQEKLTKQLSLIDETINPKEIESIEIRVEQQIKKKIESYSKKKNEWEKRSKSTDHITIIVDFLTKILERKSFVTTEDNSANNNAQIEITEQTITDTSSTESLLLPTTVARRIVETVPGGTMALNTVNSLINFLPERIKGSVSFLEPTEPKKMKESEQVLSFPN